MTVPVESIGTPALWAGFTVFVLALLALDLGVFHRKEHAVGVREALAWTAVWVALALVFNAAVVASLLHPRIGSPGAPRKAPNDGSDDGTGVVVPVAPEFPPDGIVTGKETA